MSIKNQEIAMYIIENKQHRDIRTIGYIFNVDKFEALSVFQALNIDPRIKPQECLG